MSDYLANWWHALADGRIQCDLCPRECKLNDGQRGLCFVRERRGNNIILDTWGRSSGFCLDPIEKKPLNHFYPGSSILSFGTAGCNLACKFCQNWDISKSRDTDKIGQHVLPEHIARGCVELKTPAVAFTYNDPVIFAEYAMDVADACHAAGVRTVAVTAGHIHAAPRKALFAKMDAANVDLKGFTQGFYQSLCAGDLQTVLDTLVHIKHRTNCWLEITTLLIPGANDSDAEITALSQWVRRELGADVPLHFSAFHPDYKMQATPATPPEVVIRARRIALDQGLHYVYSGNIHDPAGGTTHCPHCQHPVIVRDWHYITSYQLQQGSQCCACGATVAGYFDVRDDSAHEFVQFGRQRIPIQFNTSPA
jgi:pyruvate formate lyase activating enzyme